MPLIKTQQAEIFPAVAEHFDSVWVFDHLHGFDQGTDSFSGMQDHRHRAGRPLSWPASGRLVMGVDYRNPVLLAKMAASLQSLSGRQLILGTGAGWRGEEYQAYGYTFPKAAVVYIQRFEEAL